MTNILVEKVKEIVGGFDEWEEFDRRSVKQYVRSSFIALLEADLERLVAIEEEFGTSAFLLSEITYKQRAINELEMNI